MGFFVLEHGQSSGDRGETGKVRTRRKLPLLYEATMGKDRRQFPDLPSAVVEGSRDENLLRMNGIILKACEISPEARYRSALRMKDELMELRCKIQSGLPSEGEAESR